MRWHRESDPLHRRPGSNQENTHSPDGQSPVSQIRSVAREPDATTGSFVRLTLGKPMIQLKRQDVGWPEGRDWPESGAGEAGFSMMVAEFSKNL